MIIADTVAASLNHRMRILVSDSESLIPFAAAAAIISDPSHWHCRPGGPGGWHGSPASGCQVWTRLGDRRSRTWNPSGMTRIMIPDHWHWHCTP